MATYFEQMRRGMQNAQEMFQELVPGAEFAWTPMDNRGFYAFLLIRERSRVVVHRFTKGGLAAMGQDPPEPRELESFRISVLTNARR